MQQRRVPQSARSFELDFRYHYHAKIPSVALPSGERHTHDFSAPTLSELYVEIRKREKVSLYIVGKAWSLRMS